jgi:hypothetical protein
MTLSFDVISDFNLSTTDPFDWHGKATSLYCIVAGNISKELPVIQRVLHHLSTVYHGVFYIDGVEDHLDIYSRDQRVENLQHLCSKFRNVIYLHNNVVVVDGVAVLGFNGWSHNTDTISDEFQVKCYRFEDIGYFEKTLERLQVHADVKKIVVVSGSVPGKELFFGEGPDNEDMYPTYVLFKDTEHKVSHWVYGTYKKIVDTTIGNINYVCNGKFNKTPYYPTRIEVTI